MNGRSPRRSSSKWTHLRTGPRACATLLLRPSFKVLNILTRFSRSLVTMSPSLQAPRQAQERDCQWRVGTIQRLNGRPRSSTERAVHPRGRKRCWGRSGLVSSANPEPDQIEVASKGSWPPAIEPVVTRASGADLNVARHRIPLINQTDLGYRWAQVADERRTSHDGILILDLPRVQSRKI